MSVDLDRIADHIYALRRMAEYAAPAGVSGRQVVCSDVAMISWADALDAALASLRSRVQAQEQALRELLDVIQRPKSPAARGYITLVPTGVYNRARAVLAGAAEEETGA